MRLFGNYILSIFLVLLMLSLSYFAFNTYRDAIEYEKELIQKSQVNSIDNKLNQNMDEIKDAMIETSEEFFNRTKEYVSIHINKFFKDDSKDKLVKTPTISKTKEVTPLSETVDIKENIERNSYIYFSLISILLLLILLSMIFPINYSILIFFLLVSSLISLLVGVFAPMITMEIFKDLPVLGYTILKFESKSIYSTILNLWEHSNYVIAFLIISFSIVLPLIKTSLMFLSLFTCKELKLIHKIGKWSMADVFVVSIFISILSLNTDKFTNSNHEIGLFFYTSYVILSLIASELLTNKRFKITSFNSLYKKV